MGAPLSPPIIQFFCRRVKSHCQLFGHALLIVLVTKFKVWRQREGGGERVCVCVHRRYVPQVPWTNVCLFDNDSKLIKKYLTNVSVILIKYISLSASENVCCCACLQGAISSSFPCSLAWLPLAGTLCNMPRMEPKPTIDWLILCTVL
jgi:hypothetical protein